MTKDYKNRAQTQNRGKKQAPSWVWFISGLLIGLFFSGLVWLKQLPVPEQFAPKPSQVKPVTAENESKKADVEKEAANKPRFDFYTILPETEVVVPQPETKAPLKTTPITLTQTKQKDSDSERYMLQMGSFRSYLDADRMKANLALVGIEAEIQQVSINSGEKFHRVRSGPHNKEKLNAIRNRLKQNNVNSLVIKLK